MTLQEFYDQLVAHDWYYHFSDDGRVYRAGLDNERRLLALASENDGFKSLYDQYRDHVQSGP
jgi:hypothetical protein